MTDATDSSGRIELTLIETTLPLALWIAGGIALLAGILLSRKPREDVADLDDETREVTTG